MTILEMVGAATAACGGWHKQRGELDPRLVFLARAAARYELVGACAMSLDEAWDGYSSLQYSGACAVIAGALASMMRRVGERVAIGSMPWPEKIDGRTLAASGSLHIEDDIACGSKVKVLCWRRRLPDGSEFVECRTKTS